MHVRAGLAAIAAGMSILVAPLGAQSGRGEAPARACAGDCPEQRAEALRDLTKARAELERIARVLARGGDSLDTRQLAEARAQLVATLSRIEELERRSIRERQVMVARVRTPSPTISQEGWLGVSFSSSFEVIERPGVARTFRFLEYPVVEAVEPASPARRAGIEVGDVLLAFEQKDLRSQPIELDALLTPGRRLPVLLKRGEDRRTVTVVVAERPRGAYAVIQPTPVAPDAPRVMRIPPPGAVSPAPRPPEMPEPRVWVYAPSAESVALAGAQMALLPAQLREQVGAEGGLLVLRVAHGTPASRAGLRDGDVIIEADGASIRSSGDLQAAFRRAGERAMSLRVVRQREVMTVRMRW